MEKIHCQNLNKFGTPWGDKDPWGKRPAKHKARGQITKLANLTKMGDRPN